MAATGRNARTGVVLLGIVAGMVGLTFASVPLYRLFCQVTGFGGTTQVAETTPDAATAAGRVVTVRFNADVDPRLAWAVQPAQRSLRLKVGDSGLAFYQARNLTARPITGTATFNVTPMKAGQYFTKVQCFCFDEQRLAPGETVDMAVSFFVDPAIEEDPNMAEVETITLSYTFFRALDDGEDAEPLARIGADDAGKSPVGLN